MTFNHSGRQFRTSSLGLILLALSTVTTADPLILSTRVLDSATEVHAIDLKNEPTTLNDLSSSSSFERHKFSDNLKIRGWRVAENLYFGQAKVADRWGIGLLLKKDKVVYGVNHRGLQITRQF